jgi:hypothetical protein
MTTRRKLFFLFLLTAYNLFAQAQKTLLYNVNIIHVEDGTIQKKGAVLIEGSTIKAIGEYNKLRTGNC